MRNKKVFSAAALGLALGLVAMIGTAGVARADGDEGGPGKPMIKKHIVVVGQDGKQKVYEGNGPMVRRGYFGVALTDLTPELRTHFGVPDESGVMVAKVEPGSPAEKAGVKVGDILTRLDGHAIQSSWAVTAKVRGLEDGQQIPFEVWRNGKAQTLTITVAVKERPELDMAPFFKDEDGERLMLKMNPDDWKGLQGMKGGEAMKNLHIRHLAASPREAELEKQLKELEKRIADLERQIKKQ
jgi:membrane-associated protease RseP (regulator of RpoE activity)